MPLHRFVGNYFLNPYVREQLEGFSLDRHLRETAGKYPKDSIEAAAVSAARNAAERVRQSSRLGDKELARIVSETIDDASYYHGDSAVELLLKELERLGVVKVIKGR